MFHAIAHVTHENEILTAYICSEATKAIRDWLLSPMESSRDVLYIKSVPTSVGKNMSNYEFAVGKWWITRVVLTRSRGVSIQEFRANAHALNRLDVIASCQIEVENPMVFKLLGFSKDGLPRLIPVVNDGTRQPAYTRPFAGSLLQLAPVPLRDAYTMEVADFPYAGNREEVATYHGEYAARMASINPETEAVTRSPGVAPANDVVLNGNFRRSTGTFHPPQRLLVDIVNTQATGPMNSEYQPAPRPDGPRATTRPSFPRPPVVMPPPPTSTHRQRMPVRNRLPLFSAQQTAQSSTQPAQPSRSSSRPARAKSPVSVTIKSTGAGRTIYATAAEKRKSTDEEQDNPDVNQGASGSAPDSKKTKIGVPMTSTMKDEYDAEAGPSRILDDSAIMARGRALADISMEDISAAEDISDEDEASQIVILAEIKARSRTEPPVITLSSDSSFNTTMTSQDGSGSLFTASQDGSGSLFTHSSDSALPRSLARSPGSNANTVAEFNSSDEQMLLDASNMLDASSMANGTMEAGEVADDENESMVAHPASTPASTPSTPSPDVLSGLIIAEANMLVSESDKSDTETDPSKDRQVGH